VDVWSPEERAILEGLGPWPAAISPDRSNRFSGQADAIAQGRLLFQDPTLSSSGTVSCATCHNPHYAFTDARPVAQGQGKLERNTPSLLNLAGQRWYGWDGASDNLWAASLRPLVNAQEMDQRTSTTQLVDLAKKLAAYIETLRSPRTGFDLYRDAVLQGEAFRVNEAQFPAAARRGLRIFLASGCTACHAGPSLTNGEFHDIGIDFFLPRRTGEPARVDSGRFGGLQRLAHDPFTRASTYSDAADRMSDAIAVRTVRLEPRHFGEWKTPSLRGVAKTAPYMHNGSLATLRDVVRHYSQFNPDRVHADGEALLKPLGLSDPQIEDLVAFLESL
jgi:cytochrome c peroxidase